MRYLVVLFFLFGNINCFAQFFKSNVEKAYNYHSSSFDYDRGIILKQILNLNYGSFDTLKNSQALSFSWNESWSRIYTIDFNTDYYSGSSLSAQRCTTLYYNESISSSLQKIGANKVQPNFVNIHIGNSDITREDRELLGKFKDTFQLKMAINNSSSFNEDSIDLVGRLLSIRSNSSNNHWIVDAMKSINSYINSKPSINKLMLSFSFDYERYNKFLPILLKEISVDTLIITKQFKDYYYWEFGYDNQKIPIAQILDDLKGVKTLYFYNLNVLYLTNELQSEKLQNIKNLLIDSDTVYNLNAIGNFKNLETLELWRVRKANRISEIKTLQKLKYLSISQSILPKRFSLNDSYINLSHINLFDNLNLSCVSDSTLCLPKLKIVEFKVINLPNRNRKLMDKEYKVFSRRKGSCNKNWNISLLEDFKGNEDYIRKLSINKIK